jgi:signal transduction histidine kinase
MKKYYILMLVAILTFCGTMTVRSQVIKPADLEKYAKKRYGDKWLDAAKNLSEKVVLDKNEFKLIRGYARRALGHVVAVVTPMLEKAELTLDYDIEQQIILYEKDLLLTLVTNLVDNARKASSPGKTVTLTGRREAGRYRISVRDEGIGIPEEEISRITEAFFMVDKSRSRAQHGAGLGLAIGNRIAQIHGSTLHFESKVNVGTLVWFDVPLYTRGKGDDAE